MELAWSKGTVKRHPDWRKYTTSGRVCSTRTKSSCTISWNRFRKFLHSRSHCSGTKKAHKILNSVWKTKRLTCRKDSMSSWKQSANGATRPGIRLGWCNITTLKSSPCLRSWSGWSEIATKADILCRWYDDWGYLKPLIILILENVCFFKNNYFFFFTKCIFLLIKEDSLTSLLKKSWRKFYQLFFSCNRQKVDLLYLSNSSWSDIGL